MDVFGFDWINFLPAVQAFMNGQNPYLVGEKFTGVYEPFWTYIFLTPFALLPYEAGRIALFLVSFIAFAYTAIRLKANRWQLVLFLTSASVLGGLYDGNIDWLVMLGIWMPPQVGLFFVMMKPQIGCAIAIYWMYMTWKKGGLSEMAFIFLPVVYTYLLSFVMYGFWITQLYDMPDNPYNSSPFPYAIPMGLVLLYIALKEGKRELSIFSSLLFAPYATQYNYATLLLALINRPVLFVVAWVALWIPTLFKFIL